MKFDSPLALASLIDHTLLRPEATLEDIRRLCQEAKHYGFHAVCVNPVYVASAREWLEGSGVRVAAVVGFPLGANTTPVKVVEAMEAVQNGAQELEVVLPVGLLRSRRLDLVRVDLKNVIALTPQAVHKVILETGLLSPEEVALACRMAVEAGAQFVKTSTGFGPAGATVEDVRRIREAVGDRVRIKAAGGIRNLEDLMALVEAGADRIGTRSGVAIMEEYLAALS